MCRIRGFSSFLLLTCKNVWQITLPGRTPPDHPHRSEISAKPRESRLSTCQKRTKNVGVIEYIYEYMLELVECKFARKGPTNWEALPTNVLRILFGILLVNLVKLWKSLYPTIRTWPSQLYFARCINYGSFPHPSPSPPPFVLHVVSSFLFPLPPSPPPPSQWLHISHFLLFIMAYLTYLFHINESCMCMRLIWFCNETKQYVSVFTSLER